MKTSISFYKKVHKDRRGSFWFDGQVAEVFSGDRSISVEATGQKSLSFSPAGNIYSGAGAVRSAVKRGLTDRHISKTEMRDQNWFNLVLADGGKFTSLERVLDDLP